MTIHCNNWYPKCPWNENGYCKFNQRKILVWEATKSYFVDFLKAPFNFNSRVIEVKKDD